MIFDSQEAVDVKPGSKVKTPLPVSEATSITSGPSVPVRIGSSTFRKATAWPAAIAKPGTLAFSTKVCQFALSVFWGFQDGVILWCVGGLACTIKGRKM